MLGEGGNLLLLRRKTAKALSSTGGFSFELVCYAG